MAIISKSCELKDIATETQLLAYIRDCSSTDNRAKELLRRYYVCDNCKHFRTQGIGYPSGKCFATVCEDRDYLESCSANESCTNFERY